MSETTPEDLRVVDQQPQEEEKPRQWLIDRCDGNERVMNPNSKPCCPIFYSPLLLKFFPDFMETNRVMEFLGRTGCISPTNTRARKIIMITATLGTIVGWAFLIFSDFAVSLNNFGMISGAAFNSGSLIVFPCRPGVFDACDSEFDDGAFRGNERNEYFLGLRAIAITRFTDEDRTKKQRVVKSYDSFCAGDLGFQVVGPDDCAQCADASQAMVASILMSTVTYFFTFTTDVLRIWPNYDVNCQKVFGGFFAIISAVMGLRTWFLYRNQCFASFRNGWYCFDEQLNEIDCDASDDIFYGSALVDWDAGPGLVALGVATFAKVLDLLCNILVPTPSITRSKNEQWEYERLATVDSTAQCSDNNGDDDNNNDGMVIVENGLRDCPARGDIEAGNGEVTTEIIVPSVENEGNQSSDTKVSTSRNSSSKVQSSDEEHTKQFAKERTKLLEIIHGNRNKPISVPSKYPESILTNIVLGKGSFGEVFMGEDKEISLQFAIEAIDPQELANDNKDAVEKIKSGIKTEQRALLCSRHPNIALLYAYSLSGSPRKGHYLLYEHAAKGSLDKMWQTELGRERLSCFSRRSQIALDALIGLRFLHVGNRSVKPSFHRDIKSANIVLKEDMTAQLCNCGLETFIQEQASPTMLSTGVKGTRGYVCPRYCNGAISYDAACDIFSFGILLAELWSGSLQNHRNADGRFYNFFEEYIGEKDGPRHMEVDLDSALGFSSTEGLPDYMYDFKDLTLLCMARSPEKRPSGDQVIHRLERIWQACKHEVDDQSGALEGVRTIADEDVFNMSLQSVAHDIDSACRLCRTYATEVGFEECPLCLTLHQQRLHIAKTVSSKLDAMAISPEDCSGHNNGQEQRESCLPSVLTRMDLRLNNPIPRLFIIVPTDLVQGWRHPKTWLRRDVPTRYSLFFICGHAYKAMTPPIHFTASAAWMDRIALSYGVSLTLLELAARNGLDMNMQLSPGLSIAQTEFSELLTEVKQILNGGDYLDVLERLQSGSSLSDKDVNALNGEPYEIIVERAREEQGWRRPMAPVRQKGEAAILWVSADAAEDSQNDYEEVEY
eukprot:CAMPEP_0202503394 /NCGR_PEP_ID=MMETSP1361-20130828/41628_1 /ASSEMBLY_ACC=CAM_ASM_000849 /TAXON_ID=210615 /ORGANISM="Staurosira complex sp., Strain CCMP2646" /LENGTH=1063 /DNA_ID=CAMNT_0049136599 /DNA_START=154 /DNA_END=3348 /DNA_ORIENTATION=+